MKKFVSFTLVFSLVLTLIFSMTAPSLAETDEFTQEDAASLESAQKKLDEINKRQNQLSSDINKYSSQKNML